VLHSRTAVSRVGFEGHFVLRQHFEEGAMAANATAPRITAPRLCRRRARIEQIGWLP
jgi:hypothetical protein